MYRRGTDGLRYIQYDPCNFLLKVVKAPGKLKRMVKIYVRTELKINMKYICAIHANLPMYVLSQNRKYRIKGILTYLSRSTVHVTGNIVIYHGL